jgi:glutamate/tyrosine decarboxylase-like PLP-dependent enzyme
MLYVVHRQEDMIHPKMQDFMQNELLLSTLAKNPGNWTLYGGTLYLQHNCRNVFQIMCTGPKAQDSINSPNSELNPCDILF